MNKWRMLYFCVVLGLTIPFVPLESLAVEKNLGPAKVNENLNMDLAAALDLDACIDTAFRNNPGLGAIQDRKEMAAHGLEIQKGSRWPSLHAKAGGFIHLDDQRLIASRYNGDKGVFGNGVGEVGLVLRMPVFTGRRLTRDIEAAQLNETAAGNMLSRSRQTLVFNVSRVFYTILGLEKQLESIRFSRKVLVKSRERIQALMAAGKSARVDLLRINVRLARVEQARVRVRNDIQIARWALSSLMGGQSAPETDTVDIRGDLMPAPLMPDRKDAFQTALALRPDFKALENRVEIQSRRLLSARGKQWPQVYLEGSYGYRYMPDPADQPQGEDRLADLTAGARKEELAQVTETLRQLNARAEFSRTDMERVARLVKTGALASARSPLLSLMETASLLVRFSIPEAEVHGLKIDTPVKIAFDALPGRQYPARVVRGYPEIDLQTRTRIFEARVAGPADLVPGMFARVKLTVQTVNDAVMLPDKALMTTGSGETMAFVVKGDIAEKRKVILGIEKNNCIQVLYGIQPGDRVIVAGHGKLRNGAAVNVLPLKDKAVCGVGRDEENKS